MKGHEQLKEDNIEQRRETKKGKRKTQIYQEGRNYAYNLLMEIE